MKNIYTLTIIILLSFASNAQAGENLSSYILKKQRDAARTQNQSEYMVNKLRSLPEGVSYVVNTSVAADSAALVESRPTASELNDIATAAGTKSKVASQSVRDTQR